MSYSFPNRPGRHARHMSNTPSPLRYGFTAEIAEDVDTNDDPVTTPTRAKNPLGPLHSSSMNRRASGERPASTHSHLQTYSPSNKRTIGETSPTRKENSDYHYSDRPSSTRTGSVRSHVKSLSDTPTLSLSPDGPASSFDSSMTSRHDTPLTSTPSSLNRSTSKTKHDYSVGIGRSDSRRAPAHGHPSRSSGHDGAASSNRLDVADLAKLGHSSTSQLRDLSKMSKHEEGNLIITSPEQEVVGMHGRRRLQRHETAKSRPPGYGGRTWMDQQRQFLQAYEYLCHIGEAKDWIEDVIGKPIPPIVQLEEALRDGVTLAEIVQSLQPGKPFRIFRHEKLQFRHSDNIAIFFRFLAEMELPDLFRFELVDLYEKKNIPKVIYCIHALSWLLLKKGLLDFRIGNLVGQLQFEDHELEATQKGLDKAGISMPNFSGMGDKFGAEPEPEPVETEEERIERELQECENSILEFQSQIRGALLRTKLGDTMERLWTDEALLVQFQASIRGMVARERSNYHLEMRKFAVQLQSRTRGFLVRAKAEEQKHYWHDNAADVIQIQSLFRGRQARQAVNQTRRQVQLGEVSLRTLQAHIRGTSVRRRQQAQRQHWTNSESSIVTLQRLIRGKRTRNETQFIKTHLQTHQQGIREFQSIVRATMLRNRQSQRDDKLQDHSTSITLLQSFVRGLKVRSDISTQLEELEQHESSITGLQNSIQGFLTRSHQRSLLESLTVHARSITSLQAAIRARSERQQILLLKGELKAQEEIILQLQSQARAAFARNEIGITLEDLQAEEEHVVNLQAAVRGYCRRKQYAEKKRYFEENVKKVIKAQSYIRARQQGEAYKTLTRGKDPPANTIKNFAHLLNDSDFDFEEEVEIKRLRESVRQLINENDQKEGFITELDTKIGLLARNKIERDEVAKLQKHIGSAAMRRGASIRETFNVKSLNREARAKLDSYEELFSILQTQPQYLARLFSTLPARSATENDYKKLEGLVMSMFGHLQQRREEYYLLKLVGVTMQEELQTSHAHDLFRGSHFYSRLFGRYARGHNERRFLRTLTSRFVNEAMIANDELDLESDPLRIYRSAISNEQLRTGQRSARPQDVPAEIAIKDPETREIFIQHLQDLRDIIDAFMACIEESLQKMPYGVRYIAQQMFLMLRNSLPADEDDYHLLQLLGNWAWKTYLKPSFEESELTLDSAMTQIQRNNKKVFVDVMGQIISGRPFDNQPFLQPLQSYVQSEATPRMCSFWAAVVDVPSIDAHFDIDPIQDLHAKQKPTLSIKVADIFDIHEAIAMEIPSICPMPQDSYLRQVMESLGSAKANKAAMSTSSGEITLSLGTKADLLDDPDAEIKNLLMETKRCVLYIVRVQQGASLMDIMVKPVTPQDEAAWAALVREEMAAGHERAAYSEVTGKLDGLSSMSYRQLKAIALQNMVALEQAGRLSRTNQYQDLLNDIAVDIRHRNKRRVQRRRELEGVKATESSLREKADYLEDKLRTYNDTFEQNLNVLQKQRKKKQFLMPFSKQYNHQKELERMGKMPKYGSFKYSAQTLWEKGILISWGQHAHNGGDITISSDEVNAFSIEGSQGSMMITGASATFTWDELLEAQYEDKKELRFFTGDNTLVVGREAFMGQVSKKFWPDG